MGAGIPIAYDDEWIASRWKDYMNWNRLCNDYNKAHGTDIKYNTFKSHCNRELALNHHYSDEQLAWLRENYPALGRVKCTELFNKVFNEDKSVQAIKVMCVRMGLKVSAERKRMIGIENSKRFHPVGTVLIRTHGEPYVKTRKGWVRLKDLSYGKKPKGHIIVHLDGDVNNYKKENLMAISRSVSVKMAKNKFWSSCPEITKTGIMCCELENALSKSK